MRIDLGFRQYLAILAIAIFGLFTVNSSAKAQDWIMDHDWTLLPDSCCVIAGSFTPDGTYMGVGEDEQVYTWGAQGWSVISDSCCVRSVIIAQDGRIVGAGADANLYTKQNWSSPWELVRNSYGATTIAQDPNGIFYGRGGDNLAYYMVELGANWTLLSGEGAIINATSNLDGTILAVGVDNSMYYYGADEKWGLIPASYGVGGLAIRPSDGVVFGTGTDNHVYWTKIHRTGASGPAPTNVTIEGKWENVHDCQGGQCKETTHKLTIGVEKGKEVSNTSTFGKAVSIMVGGSATTNAGAIPGGGASVSWSVTGTFSKEEAKTVAKSFTTTKNTESTVTCSGEHILWQWVTTMRDSLQSVTAGSKINRCAGIGANPPSLTDISWDGH